MKVKELLSGPEKWTQGALARSASGTLAYINDDSACKWCLSGAIIHCYGTMEISAWDLVRKQIGTMNIATWNDAPERTFEDVKRVLELADI